MDFPHRYLSSRLFKREQTNGTTEPERRATDPARRSSAGFWSGYGAPDALQSLQGGHGESDGHFGFDHHAPAGGSLDATQTPLGDTNSDERIRDAVCERLAAQERVDPTAIEVTVEHGEVTLRGAVRNFGEMFYVERLAEGAAGVSEVHNELRRRNEWT